MATEIRASARQRINNVIKKFSFEELESSVMPTFPELSWAGVKSNLVSKRKSFTSANVAQLIVSAITEERLSVRDLNDRLSTLQLIDISYHSKRRIWHAYRLIGPIKSKCCVITRDVQSNMQECFASLNMKANLEKYTHNGITYLSLKNVFFEYTSRGRKSLSKDTIFFALFIGQEYFFSTKKIVDPDFLKGVARSMGYERSKRLKLMGKDLRSLNRLCWNKKRGGINSEVINQTFEYTEATPRYTSSGIDFTRGKQKKEYAERLIGSKPPTLELFVVKGPRQPFVHKDVATQLQNESIQIKWEFRGHDIGKFMTKLIERSVIAIPVPLYIGNFMKLGKNEITLKPDT